MKFLLGFVCGLLCLAGYLGFEYHQRHKAPCGERCGAGTSCLAGVCQVVQAEANRKPSKRRRRRPRRRFRRARPKDHPGDQLKKPTAADLVQSARGQNLKTTDYVDMSKGSASGRELSTAEVDSRFRALDRKIVACIDTARGNYDLRSGKVSVGFRIERSGAVKRVRVRAAALLMQRGLYGCIAPLVKALRFSASSRALVMTYPFALR